MSVTEDKLNKQVSEVEIEIRLSDIITFLRYNRRKFILGTLIGFIIGALYAFSKPNQFTTQITVMPESQNKGNNMGGLGSLAGLAGINLSNINAPDAIYPDIYPNVLQSVPFALDLLRRHVYAERFKAKMTLQEFTHKINESSFINYFFNNESKESSDNVLANPTNLGDAVQITKEQDELIKAVHANVSASYDKKTGIVTIVAVEPDPIVSATVARLSLDYLTNYITAYRTEKSRKQVTFLEQQVREVKKRYQNAEFALSEYRDRNRSVYLNTAKIEEQRLQAEYLLTQSLYSELSKQLEQAKIKVQEETPVFKILEPPTVPLRKSGPKRTFIMLGFATIGLIISLTISVFRLLKADNRMT